MNKRTVLLVSKTDRAVTGIRNECAVAGFDVYSANHGNDALQIMMMNPVDVVVCDAAIPDMNGFHLCFKIRECEKLKTTPVIIRSKQATEDERRMACDMGADILISHESSPKAIVEYVNDIFSRPAKYAGRGTPATIATESMHQYHEQLIARLEQRNYDLQKTQAELQRTIALFSESQQIAHLGSWELNLETFESNWSDEIFRIMGATREAIKPSLETFLSFIHPEDATCIKTMIENSFVHNTPISFNCRLVRADGAVRYIYTYAGYTFNSEGKAVRTYGITHDITEKKLAEMEIQNLNRGLEERVKIRTAELVDANQQLESFSYSVSHDLRSPLRSISAFAQLIDKKYSEGLDENGKELLRFVSDSSSKMGILIEDLLVFSRMGKKGIEKTEIDMDLLVEETWNNLSERMEHKPRICIQPLAPVMADKSMIRQVLVNYLCNAAKYSGKTENPVIEVGMETGDNELIFFVKDNGAGFDMKNYEKLFNAFQRLHSDCEFDGTGVGLAIVKRVIDRHNGRVWAEGSPGNGATFYFALPVAKVNYQRKT